MKDHIGDMVAGLDLCGVFVFGLTGAMAGITRRLDLFGVLVLSVVAANSGGVLRDLLLGATPPAALLDPRYLFASLAAGATALLWTAWVDRLRIAVLVLDSAGLAFFAVAGAQKALTWGVNPIVAALLGMLTGVGGGVARDLLVAEIPAVLRTDLYALAGLAGATVVVLGAVFNGTHPA